MNNPAHNPPNVLSRAAADLFPGYFALVMATGIISIACFLLEDIAETTFRSPRLLAITLMVMGALLWAADRFAARDRPLGTMRWRDALLIGLAQVAALVPGVSRSGSTMKAGRALRFDARSARPRAGASERTRTRAPRARRCGTPSQQVPHRAADDRLQACVARIARAICDGDGGELKPA